MNTLTIKIKNRKAVRLIKELEGLDLIKIVSGTIAKKDRKLSQSMAGSLNKNQAAAYHKNVQNLKNEWERDTY
jgi:hypothetical protein